MAVKFIIAYSPNTILHNTQVSLYGDDVLPFLKLQETCIFQEMHIPYHEEYHHYYNQIFIM